MSEKNSIEERSKIMRAVKSKDTTIEIAVRKKFYESGLRYRKNSKKILGTPDISMKKYKVAVFINGCFWHGHDGCKRATIPKTRTEYWTKKINNNKIRDENISKVLVEEGWHVYTIWECQLRSNFDKYVEAIIEEIRSVIQNNKSS